MAGDTIVIDGVEYVRKDEAAKQAAPTPKPGVFGMGQVDVPTKLRANSFCIPCDPTTGEPEYVPMSQAQLHQITENLKTQYANLSEAEMDALVMSSTGVKPLKAEMTQIKGFGNGI